ncbi:AMP-binding protein [Actinomadura madurae]|uniref:AMP-binding protein n=1 Tax=Actinomadura madurae TaxID=1993 RepID=UPI0020D21BBB|nr:AMP-binding protein [Actinomadura madurae]
MTAATTSTAIPSTATRPRLEHILSWVEHPGLEQPVRFSDGRGTWTSHSYADLAAGVRRNAHRLRAAGIGSGDTVLLIGANTPGFVMSLYGVMHAGATPSIVAPGGPAELDARLRDVARALRPAALLVTREQAPLLDGLDPPGCRVLTEAAEDGPMADGAPEPPEVGLVQFSSGSTGTPRGVQIPWPALNAHVRALHGWLSITEDSRVVSWVPFHHDMGLVGCLLMPLARGAGGSYLPPQEFIGAPARWLAEISRAAAPRPPYPRSP